MASFDFLSLRFENISENENDTYSVFLNEGEDGPEMVWYDSMGDPIIEVGISKNEWDDVKKLAGECNVASWDGYSNSKKFKFESYQFFKNCSAPHNLANVEPS